MKHDLIGWARVSTKDQSLDLQKERLKEAGCCTVFGGKHSGVSKANDKELESMIRKAEKGDTIIVTKLDRLKGALRGSYGLAYPPLSSAKERESSLTLSTS